MRKDWEVKKLGDVCDIFDYLRRPITKSERISGDYPYYGASGVQDYVDSFIFDGRYLLVGEDGAKWGKKEISSYIIEGKSWVNNHVHVLRLNESLIDSFVEYYLNYSDLTKYITGAVVPKLTQRALQSIIIPVPPLQTQHQVVEELNCLTSIIEKQKKQLNELDNLAQSIFYDMFGDPIENEKGWEFKKIEDLCSVVGGSTPKTNIPEYWDGDNYWVTPAELNEKYISSTIRSITDKRVKSANLKILPKGTVLFTSRAPIGKVSITRAPMFCNQGFKNFICSDIIINEYLYHVLLYNTEYLNSLGVGATFKEVSKSKISSVRISLPPISLQQDFASKIEAIEKQKELIKKSIKETEDLFNSRMDYYFN